MWKTASALALVSSSRPSPPPWPSRHFFLHPPCPDFLHRAVRPPFGDLHSCPPWVALSTDDTVASTSTSLSSSPTLPVPLPFVRASVRVIGIVSVAPCLVPRRRPLCSGRSQFRPSCVSRAPPSPPPFFVAVAKALRPLGSLAYPLRWRCIVPVYILVILCARRPPVSIVVASVDCGPAALPLPSPPPSSSRLPSSRAVSPRPRYTYRLGRCLTCSSCVRTLSCS